tara:strand:+ start:4901 stop:5533 length:633 start_codon:yes stop_codon:yes gene_type:complete
MKTNFFQEKNFNVVKEAIPTDLAFFLNNYLHNKRKCFLYMQETNNISKSDKSWGEYTDTQIPNTWGNYGDLCMDSLLEWVSPTMQRITGLELIPCYSYTRIYKYGDELHRHKDRPSCEISCTMNLGGDTWPIFLEPSGEENKEGISVILNPGDILVYKGQLLEHWREPFQGFECTQVFLHYNDKNGPFGETNLYDRRPVLGLPSWSRPQN